MLKVALIGYGKMGKTIDNLAASAGVEVVSRVDPKEGNSDWQELSGEAVDGADVCIEFSHPDAVLDNIRRLCQLGKPVVVGTSGWYHHLEEVRSFVTEKNASVLYAENFSIGMNLFAQIVEEAAKLINGWDSYDVAIVEHHHRNKADSPSGTAESLANILLEKIERKTTITYDRIDRQPRANELHVASVRCGSIPGTHQIIIDSDVDTITLTHQARSRQGWALGALHAAKWLAAGRQGLYHVTDMLKKCARISDTIKVQPVP